MFLVAFLLAMFAAYPLSVVWRVSLREKTLFGRSYLIPLSATVPQYTNSPTPESFGTSTYVFDRNGTKVIVYKQLINGFQHAYGSALAAFELGAVCSDLLFRANEYFEAYLLKDGSSEKHYLDTEKDLANNAVGRTIGVRVKSMTLSGKDADDRIVKEVLRAMDSGEVINNYLDPRVERLPSREEFGCPGLPPRPTSRS
jgi:hypothetical protein